MRERERNRQKTERDRGREIDRKRERERQSGRLVTYVFHHPSGKKNNQTRSKDYLCVLTSIASCQPVDRMTLAKSSLLFFNILHVKKAAFHRLLYTKNIFYRSTSI